MGRVKLLLATAVAVVSSVGIMALVRMSTKPASSPIAPQQQPKAADKLLYQNVVGRYLFNGTIFWGRGIEKWSQKSDSSYDYARPFSALSSFAPENYDAWFADLECPITTRNISFSQQIETLIFNCRPEYLPEAAKYFQFLNLANNHTDNRGSEGLAETREHLAKAGVQYFGNYDPSVADDACKVVSLPVQLKKDDGTSTKASLLVAMCAWHYFYRKPLVGEMEVMKKYAEIMPVFAFVHMGGEYYAKANDLQREITLKAVDLGAEFVIANNPHWVQDSEAYRGKLIVYSTGNFIFDQLDYETQRSASIDTTMTLDYTKNVQQWLDIAKECVDSSNDCLSKAQKQGLQKIHPTLGYSVVAGDSSNKLTKKASPELQKAVETRLNWPATMSQLK